jgi:gamma-glutamylcyclotransferase (GGCT)/AIG2-like uncharacterized protein YtfP
MLSRAANRAAGDQNLFCYGTLQIPVVIEAVVGRRFEGRAAALTGYAAFEVRGAEYPGIRPVPEGITRGQVYGGLSPGELSILDRFEGPLYQRRRLVVHTLDGRRRGAWAYVVKPARLKRLTPVLWRPRDFKRQRFRRFMQRFVVDRRDVFRPPNGTV